MNTRQPYFILNMSIV